MNDARRPPIQTDIRERLADWQRREDLSDREAAAAVGYSVSMYRAIRAGQRRPCLARVVAFQEATGIPASCFYPEAKGMV